MGYKAQISWALGNTAQTTPLAIYNYNGWSFQALQTAHS
jgi:hypothetical protein